MSTFINYSIIIITLLYLNCKQYLVQFGIYLNMNMNRSLTLHSHEQVQANGTYQSTACEFYIEKLQYNGRIRKQKHFEN